MKNSITINGKSYTPEDISSVAATIAVGMPQHLAEVFLFLVSWYDDKACIQQQTSGSTGEPSIISLRKEHMWNSAMTTNTFFSLHGGDTALLTLSTSTIAGKMMVVRAIAGSLNLLVIPVCGRPEIPETKIAFAAMVPMQMEKLLDNGHWSESIQTVILGGAAVSESLKRKLHKLQCRVYATYGMTETSSHVAVQRLNGSNPDTVFRVLPGITISINKKGCIIIEAPHILSSPIITSDLGEIPSPGQLQIFGRKDFIINSGGVKINPIPLEEHLRKQINRELVIIPLPDEKLGEKAVVVIKGEYDSEIWSLAIHYIQEIRQKKPLSREPFFIKEFPMTPTMKMNRKLLIERVLRTY